MTQLILHAFGAAASVIAPLWLVNVLWQQQRARHT